MISKQKMHQEKLLQLLSGYLYYLSGH